eukprot:scaffold242606_cov61-Attheya_sp.AAC.5
MRMAQNHRRNRTRGEQRRGVIFYQALRLAYAHDAMGMAISLPPVPITEDTETDEMLKTIVHFFIL